MSGYIRGLLIADFIEHHGDEGLLEILGDD